jgi:glutamate racemase
MDKRPIGVFDSGLGGLTAVKEFSENMPFEDIVYFGDTGRVPYGTRSRETILKYAKQDIAFLKSKNVKMIVAACGTVSSVADGVNMRLGVPFASVLEPTAEAAARATENGRIGIIGTPATIKSGSYRHKLSKINPGVQVFEKGCPLFVPLVENGFIEDGNEITRLAADYYLSDMRGYGIDTLIMGCTHYPIIKKAIAAAVGGSVTLIDSGRETAAYCRRLLKGQGMLNAGTEKGKYSFYVSDTTEGFASVAGIFLGKNINGEVRRVDIEKY